MFTGKVIIGGGHWLICAPVPADLSIVICNTFSLFETGYLHKMVVYCNDLRSSNRLPWGLSEFSIIQIKSNKN